MKSLFIAEDGRELKLTPKQRAFLSAYSACGMISHAARAAGCGRALHNHAIKKGGDYAEAFSIAKEEACEVMEAEARKRAVDGWEEPVYQGGELVGMKRKYSDVLLIFMLKGAMPEKYADRQKTEISTGDPVQVYIPENDR